jgi:hypothetical protein
MKFDVDDIMAAVLSSTKNKLYWVQQKAKKQPIYFNGHVEEVNYITF